MEYIHYCTNMRIYPESVRVLTRMKRTKYSAIGYSESQTYYFLWKDSRLMDPLKSALDLPPLVLLLDLDLKNS